MAAPCATRTDSAGSLAEGEVLPGTQLCREPPCGEASRILLEAADDGGRSGTVRSPRARGADGDAAGPANGPGAGAVLEAPQYRTDRVAAHLRYRAGCGGVLSAPGAAGPPR
ncbi:hypothetical protein GCM10010512_25740 [Streptomyces thermoviolaceus subsp. thermoviolaceus]|nr:hypothetical protein GCM10010499_30670 [Streptomyces thermoviolaceus subsp. apingens]GHA93162.1 hypothetical protein GCM10010512_25740 [Streptomyces thermoviolaceus subsp. thermoviolaceus]